MIETISKVFEVLNINGLYLDDKIDFFCLALLDSEGEEDKEEVEVIKDLKINLLMLIPKR